MCHLLCFGDVYFIGSVMVIVIAFVLYGSMVPWSPIFSLKCYSRPYGRETKFLEVSLPWSFCQCLFVNAL